MTRIEGSAEEQTMAELKTPVKELMKEGTMANSPMEEPNEEMTLRNFKGESTWWSQRDNDPQW